MAGGGVATSERKERDQNIQLVPVISYFTSTLVRLKWSALQDLSNSFNISLNFVCLCVYLSFI